jgi:hypothetical protein
MAHEPTLRKLHEMRLAAMADSYQNQLLIQTSKSCRLKNALDYLWIWSGPDVRTTGSRR